jgi:3-oxoacyl-[acyl-carrier protein] reductase
MMPAQRRADVKLRDKVAVVTGASKGIGAEIARALAAEGAAVVVNYNSDRLSAEKVVATIVASGGRAVAVQADVSKSDDIRRLFDQTQRQFGTIDVLVNNAGVYEFGQVETITTEHFDRQFGVNVLGLLLTTQEALKHFKADGGSIVNISSTVSRLLPAGSSVYSATKASVDAITAVLSKELGARRIRVNAINPGMIETEGVHAAGFIGSAFEQNVINSTSLSRVGQPDDIAPAAVFLASNDSKYMTGETLFVNGGYR